jgi:phosphoribosylanthranilate isomerase
MSCPCLLKICGLTTVADLRLAQRLGADFLGVIVEAPGSPRSLPVAVAARLARLAPDRTVAVTVSDEVAFLRRVVEQVKPRALQLHGPAAGELAAEFVPLCRVWVSVSLPPAGEASGETARAALAEIERAASAGAEIVVLDTAVAGKRGGTGVPSDWGVAAEVVAASPLPVLLAGGLGPENAAEALRLVKPAGLDCSSRLEMLPGRKDPRKLAALADALQNR